eukprot:Lithocolla_globosa_v1_NODE_63_length_7262_cov_10.450950.p1 type:complete len:1201 gc:universal NODE_63_length_7262_cov_10.450950:2687-6289(+)
MSENPDTIELRESKTSDIESTSSRQDTISDFESDMGSVCSEETLEIEAASSITSSVDEELFDDLVSMSNEGLDMPSMFPDEQVEEQEQEDYFNKTSSSSSIQDNSDLEYVIKDSLTLENMDKQGVEDQFSITLKSTFEEIKNLFMDQIQTFTRPLHPEHCGKLFKVFPRNKITLSLKEKLDSLKEIEFSVDFNNSSITLYSIYEKELVEAEKLLFEMVEENTKTFSLGFISELEWKFFMKNHGQKLLTLCRNKCLQLVEKPPSLMGSAEHIENNKKIILDSVELWKKNITTGDVHLALDSWDDWMSQFRQTLVSKMNFQMVSSKTARISVECCDNYCHFLQVCQGDILKENVNAIVNPANSKLLAGNGLALSINQAAGLPFKQECQAYINENQLLDPGKPLLTTSGLLKEKSKIQHILNIVGPKISKGAPRRFSFQQARALYEAISNTLLKADEHNIATIALSLVSSCAQIHLVAILDFLTKAKSVSRNVLIDKVPEKVTIITQQLEECLSQFKDTEMYATPTLIESHSKESMKGLTEVYRLSGRLDRFVELKNTSIVDKIGAQVIVNAANNMLSIPKPVKGATSTAAIIGEMAGSKLKEECTAIRNSQKIHAGDVFETTSGDLFESRGIDSVLHAVGPKRWNKDENDQEVWLVEALITLKNVIHSTLTKADQLKKTCLAMPLISAGAQNFPPDSCIRCHLETVCNFLQTSKNLVAVVFTETRADVFQLLTDETTKHFVQSESIFPLSKQEGYRIRKVDVVTISLIGESKHVSSYQDYLIKDANREASEEISLATFPQYFVDLFTAKLQTMLSTGQFPSITYTEQEDRIILRGLGCQRYKISQDLSKLQKSVQGVKPPTENFPDTWESQIDDMQEFPVLKGSKEWNQIEHIFLQSFPSNFYIRKIIRVQNKHIWELYQTRKREFIAMNKKNGGKEKLLFHSTNGYDPAKIYHSVAGFEWGCAREHSFHGKALYFAEKAHYSHDFFRHTKEDEPDVYQMICASVVVGHSLIQNKQNKELTKRDLVMPGTSAYFNTVLSKLSRKCDIYACYDQGQAYLIEYANVNILPAFPLPKDNTGKQMLYHCFLSHDWGVDVLDRKNHETIKYINRYLNRCGIKTWLDETNMENNTSDSMMEGIDNSAVILVFFTQKYMEKCRSNTDNTSNDNCRLEFNYAATSKAGRLIPIPMEPDMLNPSNWFGLVL